MRDDRLDHVAAERRLRCHPQESRMRACVPGLSASRGRSVRDRHRAFVPRLAVRAVDDHGDHVRAVSAAAAPSQVSCCAPADIGPEKTAATARPFCSIWTVTCASEASVNEIPSESSTPSPFGVSVAVDSERPESVRSTANVVCRLPGAPVLAGGGDGQRVEAVVSPAPRTGTTAYARPGAAAVNSVATTEPPGSVTTAVTAARPASVYEIVSAVRDPVAVGRDHGRVDVQPRQDRRRRRRRCRDRALPDRPRRRPGQRTGLDRPGVRPHPDGRPSSTSSATASAAAGPARDRPRRSRRARVTVQLPACESRGRELDRPAERARSRPARTAWAGRSPPPAAPARAASRRAWRPDTS